jgi:DnaD/phage-associated family protein
MKNNYKADLSRLCQNPAFAEASAEEMRVLLTLVSLEERPTEESDITRLAGVSAARCRAAIAFWEGAGILSVNKTTGIVEEFEERLSAGEIDEEPTLKVAETIRDENLAMMIDECQALMGVPCLSNQEVANLTNLHKQYQLSAEYIVVLAAFLQSKGEFTIRKLCNKAISLEKKGISTADDLDKYIVSLDSSDEWEFRRIIGIYGRNLSQGERDLFKKWAEEYGYTSAIVSEAYDIAVMNTKSGDLRYMDRVLTNWYDAGCKTVSECRAYSESERAKSKAQQTEKKYAKSRPETPRYGNFDVNEAFFNAVERSFGEKEED